MVRVGLFIRVEAKPGKEEEVSRFLNGAVAAKREGETAAWFALRFGFSSFGIFETFEDEAGRRSPCPGKLPRL